MPIYEYRCKKCDEKFEALRSLSASDQDVTCPKCGAKKPERVISAVCGGHVPGADRGNLRFPS